MRVRKITTKHKCFSQLLIWIIKWQVQGRKADLKPEHLESAFPFCLRIVFQLIVILLLTMIYVTISIRNNCIVLV